MRILVTGGAGFIGSALARRLISEAHDVVVIDNLSTGKRSNVPAQAQFVEANLADKHSLSLIPPGRYDAMVHLAAQSSGIISQKDPYIDMQANVGSTVLLSRWCLDRTVPRFLYASSMTVYGNGNREPVAEDFPCIPISYYAASKLASETYLRLAANDGLDVTCLRLYNVYGRGQDLGNYYQGMASIYLAYLLDGVAVPVTGSLERYRDFVHVDDVVEALVRSVMRSSTLFRTYNIGTGEKTTVCDLLRQLIAAMDLPSDYPIDELAGSPHDVFGSIADCGRIRKELGWTPRVSLEEGIADMVVWAKNEKRSDK